VAVEEELTAALGAARYARDVGRGGYRNGHRSRTVTGPTGPLALTLPRATLFTAMDAQEWTSALVPRYQRRLREVNEAVVATYLAGGNTRRLRGALGPLLKAAPLSKSAVSRVVGTLKAELEAWRTRSLADVNVFPDRLRRERRERAGCPCGFRAEVGATLPRCGAEPPRRRRGSAHVLRVSQVPVEDAPDDKRHRAAPRGVSTPREDPGESPDRRRCARPAGARFAPTTAASPICPVTQ
jgi:hypothetical protein